MKSARIASRHWNKRKDTSWCFNFLSSMARISLEVFDLLGNSRHSVSFPICDCISDLFIGSDFIVSALHAHIVCYFSAQCVCGGMFL